MKTIYLLASLGIFLICSSAYSHAQENEERIVRGNIVCVELDEAGGASVSEDFQKCEGVVYMLGVDGKISSIHGSEEEMKKLSAGSKTRMGYRLPLRLKGTDAGHQRAWRLNMDSLEPLDKGESEKIEVTGTIFCIFPNYKDGNVTPMVATAPCNEDEDHAHVIYTSEGKTYAIHGPQEKITAIEKTPVRKNVTLTGTLQGNSSGWILYVD